MKRRVADGARRLEEVLKRCQRERTELEGYRVGLCAHITRVLDHNLYLTCTRRDPDVVLGPDAVFLLEFNHGTSSGAFFARVVNWTDVMDVVVERPKQLLYVDVRRSFRVPTQTLRGLVATLATGHVGPVLDVSRTGVRVALAEVPVAVGGVVNLGIQYEDLSAQLRGRVVMLRANELAVALIDPPDAWLRLVSRLEREWMRRNRG